MSTCKYCKIEEGDMISCATCLGYCHPSCLELPEHIVPVVKTYDWQCNDCKYCYACHNIENEEQILFCDSCDRGYHTYCVRPKIRRKPKGDWYCVICAKYRPKSKQLASKQKNKFPEIRVVRKTRNRKVIEIVDDKEPEIEIIKGRSSKDEIKIVKDKEQEQEIEMIIDKGEKQVSKIGKEKEEERETKIEKREEENKETNNRTEKENEIGEEKVKGQEIVTEEKEIEKEIQKVKEMEKVIMKEKAEKDNEIGKEKVKGQEIVTEKEKEIEKEIEKVKEMEKVIMKEKEIEKEREKVREREKEVEKEKEVAKQIEKEKEVEKRIEKEKEVAKEIEKEKEVEKEIKHVEKMEKEIEKEKEIQKETEEQKIEKENMKEIEEAKKEKTIAEKEETTEEKAVELPLIEEKNVTEAEIGVKLEETVKKSENDIITTPNTSDKPPKTSVEKSSSKDPEKVGKGGKENGKKLDEKTSPLVTLKENKSGKGHQVNENETVEENKSSKKKCMFGKKFSETNQCPFFGCDGTGNTRNSHNFHLSLTHCPMSKESRKREKELLNTSRDETSPPKKKILLSTPEAEKSKEIKKDKNMVTQTPIENIVSGTDIELFEQAKSKAVMALCQEMAPNPDGLKSIVFGDVEINVWYKSQYAIEYSKLQKLYICEFCLSYMKTKTIYERHMAKCRLRNPPGDEIYRKDNHSVFEINGATANIYCQNLCLMAKLFLDHKTLWLDVAPFLFYIMTINDERGCHIVGYFSKEKVSFLNYNVSCILVLPHHMKKGYGRLLIDFSYLLTAAEGKTGSPERPLSDMGLMSYRKFWAEKLLKYLIDYPDKEISVKAISESMAIQANDVVSTLQYLGLLKYWKGKHLILLRKEVIVEYALKVKGRPEDYKEIDASCLTWTPTNARAQ